MTHIYKRGAERRREAEVRLRTAKEHLRTASLAERSGVAALRLRDWKPSIVKSFGASLSGDRLRFSWIAHEGSFGAFVQSVVDAEADGGHVGGATFYRTQEDMLAARRESPPPWRTEAVWRPSRRGRRTRFLAR